MTAPRRGSSDSVDSPIEVPSPSVSVAIRSPRGGLEAAEAESNESAQPGPRKKTTVLPGRGGSRLHDRRPARIRQAQQPADLSNASPAASSTGLPRRRAGTAGGRSSSTRKVCPPETINATRREERLRHLASLVCEPRPRTDGPSRWFDRNKGLAVDVGNVLAKLMPTSSEPASPGPLVTANGGNVVPADSRLRPSASSRTGYDQRR